MDRQYFPLDFSEVFVGRKVVYSLNGPSSRLSVQCYLCFSLSYLREALRDATKSRLSNSPAFLLLASHLFPSLLPFSPCH